MSSRAVRGLRVRARGRAYPHGELSRACFVCRDACVRVVERTSSLRSRQFEGVKRLNCDWVAEKRERCTESGILMEEFEESEDDEDPNKPGPIEAYAFRACGKACGTCE